jgi:hypothetical protein
MTTSQHHQQQILLQLPSGTFAVLHHPLPISYQFLLSEVCSREALSPSDVRLSIGHKVLTCEDDLIKALEIVHPQTEQFSDVLFVKSTFRLLGGKGGFGALLRGGPTGIIFKKTTNFSSCRDLNGRRLRNIEREKRIAGKKLFISFKILFH